MNLAEDQQRIEHAPDIVDDNIIDDFDDTGVAVDLDLTDVAAVGIGRTRWQNDGAFCQPDLHTRGQARRCVGSLRDIDQSDRAVGALDGEVAVVEADIGLGGLQQMGGDTLGLVDNLFRRPLQRRAADADRARAKGSFAVGHHVGVAIDDVDLIEVEAEQFRSDLAERRFVSLSVGVGTHRHGDAAIAFETNCGAFLVCHRQWPAGDFDNASDAEAAQLSLFARSCAPGFEAGAVGRLDCHVHDRLEVAGVVGKDKAGVVGQGVARNQISPAQLDRVEPVVVGRCFDQPFDRVGRLGSASAAVCRCRAGMGVDAAHLGKNMWGRIYPGQASQIVGRRVRAGETQIATETGFGADAQSEEIAVAIEGQAGRGYVVAGVVVGR